MMADGIGTERWGYSATEMWGWREGKDPDKRRKNEEWEEKIQCG